MTKTWNRMIISAALIGGSVFLISIPIVHAKTTGTMQPLVRVFDESAVIQETITAYASSFRGGVNVATGDIDGDGVAEIITGAGAGGGPEVRIFKQDGALYNRFFAYGRGFRGGVRVASFDLDGDGAAEIITGPGVGGGPEVKVFTADGVLRTSFFAYDRGFRGGISVAAGNLGERGEALIVTGSGYGSNHVRVFTPNGKYAGVSLRPFHKATHGVTVAVLPVPNMRSKIVVAPERSEASYVRVYNLDKVEKPELTFLAYDKRFKGGVRLGAADINDDGVSDIVTGAGPGGGPNVRVFDQDGTLLKNFMAFDTSFRGGLSVAAFAGTIVVGPGAIFLEGRTDLYKYVQVDLSDQVLKFYQNGRLVGAHKISTGKWDTPTPIGRFAIKNKIPNAYSRTYDLYMEWWMAFTPDGGYGVHALPYWKTPSGGKRYEGVGHLGTPVSHGCIRQTLEEARHLYRWADIGTPLFVRR